MARRSGRAVLSLRQSVWTGALLLLLLRGRHCRGLRPESSSLLFLLLCQAKAMPNRNSNRSACAGGGGGGAASTTFASPCAASVPDRHGHEASESTTAATTRRKSLRRILLGTSAATTTAALHYSPPWSLAATTVTTTTTVASTAGSSTAAPSNRNDAGGAASPLRHPFVYADTWTGTRLQTVSLEDSVSNGKTHTGASNRGSSLPFWEMGRWPDPALRVPAGPVDPAAWRIGGTASPSSEQQRTLRLAATILRNTALREGAVGLAAQQCGVDARMVFVSSSPETKGKKNKSNNNDLVLINPRIVARSPEPEMRVWTEECLVLPPTFRATVLRDDWIEVEFDGLYEFVVAPTTTTTTTTTKHPSVESMSYRAAASPLAPLRRRFEGEPSRCLQHELDHDRGILITDHVGLDELESDAMRAIEAEGHDGRQAIAYSRD